jgi:two-component system, NtrC family, sensor histidine kinase KinB
MFGLREKLILGFGGLLGLILVTGAVGLYLLSHFSGTVDRVFRENFNSVAYGQNMKDALDHMAETVRGGRVTPEVRGVATAAQASFEENLSLEAGNITVPGEGEAVSDLTASWTSFRNAYRAFLATAPDSTALSASTRSSLDQAVQQVKKAAQRIIDLNLLNIVSADGEIRHDATNSRIMMISLLISGVIVAGLVMVLLSRSLLGPLRTLTRSAQEIEHGNLDLVVAVTTRDEIGQLAEAFNAMAIQLRKTQRSEQEKIIRAQRTTLLALDSLPDAVATITTDGLVDLANQTAQRLFRLRPGVALETLDSPRLVATWRQAVASGQGVHPHGFDTTIQVFDGDERFFLPHALPIKDHDGQAVGVTLVLADITNLRRLDEMKSNLVAVVSHELKTPLTSLRMATHLLLDEKIGSLSAKQAELVISARDDSARLQSIVDGLLDISRIESGRALMDLKAMDPRTLIERAIASVRSAFNDKGLVLESEVPDDLPQVQADEVRIAHVFGNLLSNSLRYTPSGGRVCISAQKSAEGVEFRVEDTGIGVPADHRARIFERFYRVPGQVPAGAGLGLAIAKEIVVAHGGQIWLADQASSGSTFCFLIPAAHKDEASASA